MQNKAQSVKRKAPAPKERGLPSKTGRQNSKYSVKRLNSKS